MPKPKTLFESRAGDHGKGAPLADRMRPRTLAEYEGQRRIVGEGTILREALERDEVPSMILWGPPGSGKTTLANIIAKTVKSAFVPFSAVSGTVKEIREVIAAATDRRSIYGKRTILFVDEIHRFNKAQQDAFLPAVENGTVVLVGATTENPSFEVNSALLSRCRVFVLEMLDTGDLVEILRRALADAERGLGSSGVTADDDALAYLAAMSNGDARVALNALELAANASWRDSTGTAITRERVAQALQKTHLLYDRAGEEHYNVISALHKSLRGSDANAALYWLGRMLEAGEDPLYVARRLVRFASEDVGLADPNALVQAVAAFQATHQIGMPECNVILAQCAAYLARAPKSNALYMAYKQVQRDIRELPAEPVPIHLRNAPTRLMKDLGYGDGYKYTPDFDHPEDAAQAYLPERLRGRTYLG
jgi:putative ATPase